jgi:hypothetical protein
MAHLLAVDPTRISARPASRAAIRRLNNPEGLVKRGAGLPWRNLTNGSMPASGGSSSAMATATRQVLIWLRKQGPASEVLPHHQERTCGCFWCLGTVTERRHERGRRAVAQLHPVLIWQRRTRALWRSTQQHSVHLALTSLGLGSCWPLVRFFKSSSAAFQIEMGKVEAQKKRGSRFDRQSITAPTPPTQPTQPAGPASIGIPSASTSPRPWRWPRGSAGWCCRERA